MKTLKERKTAQRIKICAECKQETENAYQSANGDVICPRCYIEIMSSVTEQD